jgi:Protein of unknown function (DUF2911)
MWFLLAVFIAQSPVKPSQHGSVMQEVADAAITIEYDRPVARGRELFGVLVPYDRVWCPGANECTTIAFSRDVKFNGQLVAAGTYTLWAKPGEKTWTMILNRAHPTFHTQHARVEDQDFLKVEIAPKAGPPMETLAFYFPVVDGRHAELWLHWGTVIVPMTIDIP